MICKTDNIISFYLFKNLCGAAGPSVCPSNRPSDKHRLYSFISVYKYINLATVTCWHANMLDSGQISISIPNETGEIPKRTFFSFQTVTKQMQGEKVKWFRFSSHSLICVIVLLTTISLIHWDIVTNIMIFVKGTVEFFTQYFIQFDQSGYLVCP